jgi:hypothetical protein
MIKLKSLIIEWGEKQSKAGEQARALGLTSLPFGQYADESGKVVAKSVNGQLVKVEPKAADPEYEKRMQHAKSWEKEDPQLAGKLSKAAGMQRAARERQASGNLTGREMAAQQQKQASNFRGKQVKVNGQPASIIGQAWGRVKVRYDDGREAIVNPEQIGEASTLSAVSGPLGSGGRGGGRVPNQNIKDFDDDDSTFSDEFPPDTESSILNDMSRLF